MPDNSTTTPKLQATADPWEEIAAAVLEEHGDLWRRLAAPSPAESRGSTKASAAVPIVNSGENIAPIDDPRTGYHCLSYAPQWLHSWRIFNPPIGWLARLFYGIWRRWFCAEGVHLWDETWSPDNHFFVCDACELIVNISSIDDTYVQRSIG